MIPETVPVVCFATGDFCGCPDLYLNRLFGMLSRHMPMPFTLTCISDLPRQPIEGVEIRHCSDWSQFCGEGIHPTMAKLRLFDSALQLPSQFLYIDLSVVIRNDMKTMLDFAFGSDKDLVIVNDWSYPCYNSCLMRIRSGTLQTIYDAFVSGKRYIQHLPVDQDFIYQHLADQGLKDHVALFPEGQIVSYRKTRTLNRINPEAARRKIRDATIVKFHGSPKMHQVANPFYNLFKIRLRKSRYGGRDASFFMRELRREWRT